MASEVDDDDVLHDTTLAAVTCSRHPGENLRLCTAASKCQGQQCRDSSCQTPSSSSYRCPECDFRLCRSCALSKDPSDCLDSNPLKVKGENLWEQPMEGLGDLEDWDQPTERLWDSPTESVSDRPSNNGRGDQQTAAAAGTAERQPAEAVTTTNRGRRRLQRPQQPGSPAPRAPLQTSAAEDRSGDAGLWDDHPSKGVWDAPTAEGLWDAPMERETGRAGGGGGDRQRPPEYYADSGVPRKEEELPPTYDECVRLGLAE